MPTVCLPWVCRWIRPPAKYDAIFSLTFWLISVTGSAFFPTPPVWFPILMKPVASKWRDLCGMNLVQGESSVVGDEWTAALTEFVLIINVGSVSQVFPSLKLSSFDAFQWGHNRVHEDYWDSQSCYIKLHKAAIKEKCSDPQPPSNFSDTELWWLPLFLLLEEYKNKLNFVK